MQSNTTVVLWLFTINLGIAFGAGIYEARIVVPLWAGKMPAGFSELDTGRRFWGFVTTMPLTLLCIASMYMTYPVAEPFHTPWLFAASLVLAERFLTFGYFIPTIVRLQKGAFSDPQRKFRQWRMLNLARNGIILLAWIGAMKALTSANH